MSCTGKNAEILKEIQAKHRAEDAAAPALTQQRKVGSGEWMDGQPSRAELISVIAALIEPRVGGDKKAQLARARQAAREVLARAQPSIVPVSHAAESEHRKD